MTNVLIIGYGNPDREDDGVGWHVLQKLSDHLGQPVLALDGGVFEPSHNPQLIFVLQLTPEMAESVAEYDFVCFVDAHTGAFADDVRLAPIRPGYQPSPFTHHFSPESCLELAQALYGRAPTGLVVSVRGYHFGYHTELSPQTALLVDTAVNRILNWINQATTLTTPDK
jgi:hydrogenase maturation protease